MPTSASKAIAYAEICVQLASTGGNIALMVAILIEVHHERRDAEPADRLLEEAKLRRREEVAKEPFTICCE